jgi:hypothetical protein
MVQANGNIEPIPDGISITELFFRLEKESIGYEDYINADEAHYLSTLEGFNKLVEMIKSQSIFSDNETLEEIHTEHMKMLMVPYHEA